jgi:hypothetical protein
MKAAQIMILVIATAVLMNWVRGDYDFSLPMVLPLLGGKNPSYYDVAATTAIVIAILGLLRLFRRRD